MTGRPALTRRTWTMLTIVAVLAVTSAFPLPVAAQESEPAATPPAAEATGGDPAPAPDPAPVTESSPDPTASTDPTAPETTTTDAADPPEAAPAPPPPAEPDPPADAPAESAPEPEPDEPAVASASLAEPAIAAAEDCTIVQLTHTRNLTVYYGTVTVAGGGDSQDGLQLTDRITADLELQVSATYPDPRVTGSIAAWVRSDINDMEWVLGPPDGLDAEAALRAGFAAFAAAQGGALAVGDPIDHGSETYFLDSWTTLEPAPGCPNEVRPGNNQGYARVTYVELNATAELPSCDPTTVSHTRDLSIHFGTVAVPDGPGQDGLQLTDFITSDVANVVQGAILGGAVDPRAGTDLLAWVDDSGSDIDWVLGTPIGFDAETALLAGFASFAEAQGGGLALEAPIDRGSETYLIEQWSTFEEAPGCPAGLREIFHEGFARVAYVERNATVAPADDPATCLVAQTHTRDTSVYFGTVTVTGGASQDGLQLTDHITFELRFFIERDIGDGLVDPRVGAGLASWIDDGVNDMEWVLGPPEGLLADLTLQGHFSAFVANQGGSALDLADRIIRGIETYNTANWTTLEPAAGCPQGQRLIEHVGQARVTYVELNATEGVETDPCAPQIERHRRDLTVYYGTVSVAGGPSRDGLQLSDHITNVLSGALEADPRDPRITAGLPGWVNLDTALAWVLAPPEGLDAEGALRDDFAAFAATQGGTLAVGAPMDRGAATYQLAVISTFEDAGECADGFRVVSTAYAADVRFVELNASVELPSCEIPTVTHTRDLTVYFGTVTVAGGASQDGLALTDHITHSIEVNVDVDVAAGAVDPRAGAGLTTWVDDGVNDMDWVLGPPEGILAELVLESRFAAFVAAQGGTSLDLAEPIVRGAETYGIAVWTTFEPVAGCPQGQRRIDHEGFARVTYVELNATDGVEADPCVGQIEIHRRDLTVYVGTVAVAGGGASQDGLELTDRITLDHANGIEFDGRDQRIVARIDDWVDTGVDDVEWLLGVPEGLDAEGNLRAGYAAFAAAQGGALVVGDPIDRGIDDYLLETWATFQDGPGCPDNTFEFTEHYGYARVTYVELNATVTLDEDPPAAPPPASGSAQPTTSAGGGDVTALPSAGTGTIAADERRGERVSLAVFVVLALLGLAGLAGLDRRRRAVWHAEQNR